MAKRRPDEITVLRRLVEAQDKLLRAYRLRSPRTPEAALDEIRRCRTWLEEIEQERASIGGEGTAEA